VITVAEQGTLAGALFSLTIGYAIGSVPTAGMLARLRGIDLRALGSGNPGANNALRTGGPGLAAAVLLVEASKGYLAVWLGMAVGGEPGAIAAGLAAIAGNVFNIWYRFGGGKGLGISLGVLAAAWPVALVPTVVVLVASVLASRSAGIASLAGLAALVIEGVVWEDTGWPTGGVTANGQLLVLALGMALLMGWKHWRDSPLNLEYRYRTRAGA
jgi:acyl phosphate:glycerol-3-phosphate acyltransferase